MQILNIYTPFGYIGKYLFQNKLARILSIVIILASAIGAILVAIYASIAVENQVQKDFIIDELIPIIIIPGGIITFCYLIYILSEHKDKLELQLERLRNERQEITQKIENEKELDIFHTIQLSLNQLNEYYTINKSQAKSSFRFSIFSIVLGLITILTGIWMIYFGNSNIQTTFITGVSGIILEFIGGAYFFMYKKSIEQVNFFFAQLIKIQDTMLAINLTKNIPKEEKQIETTEKIIMSLLERSLK